MQSDLKNLEENLMDYNIDLDDKDVDRCDLRDSNTLYVRCESSCSCCS